MATKGSENMDQSLTKAPPGGARPRPSRGVGPTATWTPEPSQLDSKLALSFLSRIPQAK